VAETVERLGARGRDDLDAPDADARAAYDLRYAGQAFELTVHGGPAPEPRALRAAFDTIHRDHYGFEDADAGLELVTVRVAVAEPGAQPRLSDPPEAEDAGTRAAVFDGARLDARIVRGVPERINGPAIVELPGATLVVPPGWRAEHAQAGTLVMERSA
jgi:N-methylhydantoinase A/oxoprolinase/acetone carboxylase beta subunit